jgi:4-alpha-glucanotransferase
LPVDALFTDDTFCDRLLAVDRARGAATVPSSSASNASSASPEPDTP